MEYSDLVKTLGLRRKTVKELETHLTRHFCRQRKGPSTHRSVRFIVLIALMRLRTALPLRALARLFRIDHVTLWRYCRMVVRLLSEMFIHGQGKRTARLTAIHLVLIAAVLAAFALIASFVRKHSAFFEGIFREAAVISFVGAVGACALMAVYVVWKAAGNRKSAK